MVKPVLIYADEGTSEVGVASLLVNVPLKLKRQAIAIYADDILHHALAESCGLIIPGGADLPYCAKLNGRGNQLIRAFIAQGGVYVGICAGAYYACEKVDFVGKNYQVKGERELALFQGTAKGCLPQLTSGHYFSEQTESKALTPLRFAKIQANQTACYYHGGPTFIGKGLQAVDSANIFAFYQDGFPAVISGNYGKGRYLLSGVHFELEQTCYLHYIVEQCPPVDRPREQQIARHLTTDYGNEIWREIARLLD